MRRDVGVNDLALVDEKGPGHLARISDGPALSEAFACSPGCGCDRSQAKELAETSLRQLEGSVQVLVWIAGPELVEAAIAVEEVIRLLFGSHVNEDRDNTLFVEFIFHFQDSGDRPTTEDSAKVPKKNQEDGVLATQRRQCLPRLDDCGIKSGNLCGCHGDSLSVGCGWFHSADLMALTSSREPGLVADPKWFSTRPSRPTRNFSKFHRMSLASPTELDTRLE